MFTKWISFAICSWFIVVYSGPSSGKWFLFGLYIILLFIMEGNGSDDQKALLIVFSKGPS